MNSKQVALSTRVRSSATPVELFETRPGTYALLLQSTTTALTRIGLLGHLHVRPGYYMYVGSALGWGGLRARLAHHLHGAARPHWHIDYLTPFANIQHIWLCYDRRRREHLWAKRIALLPGAIIPMPGFGSSDCDCESHLFLFAEPPRLACLKDAHVAEIAPAHFHQSRNSR